MSKWEKVLQDRELLAKVEDFVRGLVIDSPQEVFDEMNRITGNAWTRKEYELHCFDYPDFYDMEEVVYALFHDGNYPPRTREDFPCNTVTYKLKYMFDWRSGVCLWADNEATKAKFDGYPVDICDLSISDELRDTLDELIYLYDEHLNPEEPNGDLLWDKNQIESFLEAARGAYESLCLELGTEYEIEMSLDDFDDVLKVEPSDSKVIIELEDERIKVSGKMNLGYIGTFKDDEIEINDTLEEIREWDIVQDNLDEDCTDEELIAFLNRYFNEFADKITRNIDNINGTFLLQTLTDMECNEIDFMEIEELFLEDKLPYGNEEDIAELYNFARDGMRSLIPYLESPNDGCIPKGHIEALLRSFFPAFNFDCFIKNIVPEVLTLCDGSIAFQCSDDFDCAILCGAYAELDEELCFTDWHNF